MNYKKLTLQLFLLLLIGFQARGMMISNIHKKQREERHILNKSNLIDTLPKEVIENIFITYILNEESQQVNAIPCVSTTWNEMVTNGFFINKLIKINQEEERLALFEFTKLNVFKKYTTINQQLFDACDQENTPLEKIQEILNNPYVNINHIFFVNYREATSLCAAAFHMNLELIQFLLDNKADINAASPLSFALFPKVGKNIESSIKVFTMLYNAGAKDADGFALRSTLRFSHSNSAYYETIPLFKNTDTNSNNYGNYGEISLHILLDHNYNSIPDKNTLMILMRDYNANPHIKGKYNSKTAYDLAQELETKYNDSEYLEIIQKYDKGIEWYEKNPKGCYTEVC